MRMGLSAGGYHLLELAGGGDREEAAEGDDDGDDDDEDRDRPSGAKAEAAKEERVRPGRECYVVRWLLRRG
jgi:hypothetical protein